jgi:gliding motility-associated lipoprotein GldH
MKSILYLFTLSLLLTSCGPDFLLNEEQEVLSEFWQYDDMKSFDVAIDDISLKYNLHFLVTHSKEYDYENVYMKIHTKFPTKDKREEQITIQLANKRGEWVGKCNSLSCTVKVYLLEGFMFPEEGDYTFSFEQFTRDSELMGIEKLQLQLFPMKEKS